MTALPTRRSPRLRLSDRAFWAAVALGCAGILSSSVSSQHTTNSAVVAERERPTPSNTGKTGVAGATAAGTPTPYLRTRLVEITDAQGRARIRMLVRADGEAVVEFVRPGGSANAPTLALYDMLHGKPDTDGKIPLKTAYEGATGIHLNGPPHDGQYGLIHLERAGGSDATIRVARGTRSGTTNNAVLDPAAVRFLKSAGDIKARVLSVGCWVLGVLGSCGFLFLTSPPPPPPLQSKGGGATGCGDGGGLVSRT